MTKTLTSLLPMIKSIKQVVSISRTKPLVCSCYSFVTVSCRNYSTSLILRTRSSSSPVQTDDADINFKTQLISSLNLKTTEEALPFYRLSVNTLILISRVTRNDEHHGYCKNRVYYIAKRLKMDPLLISERLAKRTFIYSLSFDWLKNSLDVLLEMGVTPDRIVRDLWVLKYHHATIREKLQSIKDMGIDTMCPWMVRCSVDILNRFITISQETKNILGDTKSTQIYLANRLLTDPETIDDLCCRLPALRTIRVTKLKSFLDFLLKEGFTVEDITRKARILTASQKTVKQRLDKLRKLGLKEINLNVLCRSRREFRKYCESIESGSSQPQAVGATTSTIKN